MSIAAHPASMLWQCPGPGCAELTEGGPCPKHRRDNERKQIPADEAAATVVAVVNPV